MPKHENFRDGPHNTYMLQDLDDTAMQSGPVTNTVPGGPLHVMPIPSMPLHNMPPMTPMREPPMVNMANMVYAMAYVPDQQWDNTYEIEAGLSHGTIFPELDKPFMGRG